MSNKEPLEAEVKRQVLIFQIIVLVFTPIILGVAVDIESWTLGIFAGFWLFLTILSLVRKRD